MKKELVFIGGGHAHLSSISNIDEFLELGANVTVISPSEYLYYSGMGPGMLGGFYKPSECRFNIKQMVEQAGGEFIEGKVTKVDPEKRVLTLEPGTQISYDIASFDVGSYIPSENIQIKESKVTPVKPISNLVEARHEIEKLKAGHTGDVFIIGGGPSGTEIAGNLWRISSKYKLNFKITLITDDLLLSEHPIKIRKYALKSLKERGIDIRENQKVERLENNTIYLENNQTLQGDLIFLAIGTKPLKIFENSGIPTSPDSAMIVNKYLQSIKYPNVFGGGDCIEFEERKLDRVGVYAVRENPILLHNIKASIQEKPLKAFSPQKKYLLILNLGNGKGILWRGRLTYKGKLAFCLKNFIDKRFMKKYKITS